MGDDFDLFPKRENLDPFSFGTKEKAEKPGEAEGEEEMFGGRKPVAPPAPDQPGQPPLGAEPSVDVGAGPPGQPAGMRAPEPFEPTPSPPAPPPPEPSVDASVPFGADDVLPEDFTTSAQSASPTASPRRRAPSPFILILGALTLVIGILYGVYALVLKKEPPPPAPLAPVAVKVQPPAPPAPTAPEPARETVSTTAEPAAAEIQQGPSEPAVKAPETPAPEPARKAPAMEIPEPAAAPPATVAPTPAPASPKPAPPAPAATGKYSVQVGALILDSSVKELAGRLETMGYEPIFKEGSTTAMMNMLSVGPFATMEEARAALSRIRRAGIEANLRRRSGGGGVINAGSYLLENNARAITRQIRSLGYPVQMTRQETKLGMTMVRVGQYETIEEASTLKAELKSKGLDAIVVKLQ